MSLDKFTNYDWDEEFLINEKIVSITIINEGSFNTKIMIRYNDDSRKELSVKEYDSLNRKEKKFVRKKKLNKIDELL